MHVNDHYATLGVAPRSEAAEIRVAYLALMRQYHPDKNDSPAAVERAHAVIAAYAVLGDVEKRLSYDWARRRAAEAAATAPRWRMGKKHKGMIAAALALLLLVPLSLIRSPETVADAPVKPTARVAEAEPIARRVAEEKVIATPAAKLEPVPNPMLEARVERVPPEPAPARPRPAKVDAPAVAAAAPKIALAPRARPAARKAVEPQAPPGTNARCRLVRPGAEAAICNNDNLAALDRTVVAFYNQSLQYGAATKRGALLDSRNDFLARREGCRSDDCLQSLHLTHLRAMTAIMESRPAAPR